MTSIQSFQFTENGKEYTWCVSDRMEGSGGEVLIPVSEIDGLTDEQIALHVKRLSKFSTLLCVESTARWLLMNTTETAQNWKVVHELEEFGILSIIKFQRPSGDPMHSEIIDEVVDLYYSALHQTRIPKEKTSYTNNKNNDRSGYIYLIKGGDLYKIGKSKSPNRRLNEIIGLKLPFECEIIHSFRCNDMHEAENKIHTILAPQRVNGEWFNLRPEQIDYFKSL